MAPEAPRWRLLLALAVAILVLQPLTEGRAWGGPLIAVLFALACAGTGALARSRAVRRSIGIGVPAGWLALALLADALGGPGLRAADAVASLALTALLAWITVEALVREPEATADTLAGAVFGYLVLAIAFARLHGAVEAAAPGAYAGPGDALAGSDFVYFSLVTLTTLGYGDVLPVAPFARVLAGTQAVVGVLYVAVLIGRVVAALSPPPRAG